MDVEKPIDDLIEAGWMVLNSNFDEGAFRNWRKKAAICLASLLGADHTYTEYFQDHVRRTTQSSLLAGVGILTAAGMDTSRATRLSGRLGPRVRPEHAL